MKKIKAYLLLLFISVFLINPCLASQRVIGKLTVTGNAVIKGTVTASNIAGINTGNETVNTIGTLISGAGGTTLAGSEYFGYSANNVLKRINYVGLVNSLGEHFLYKSTKFSDLTNDYPFIQIFGTTNSITAATWTQITNFDYVAGQADPQFFDITNQKFVGMPAGRYMMQIDFLTAPTATNVNQVTQARYYNAGGTWAATQSMALTKGTIIHYEKITETTDELKPYFNIPVTGTITARITLQRIR